MKDVPMNFARGNLSNGYASIESHLGMKNQTFGMSDFIDGRPQLGAPDKDQDEYLQRMLASMMGEDTTGVCFELSPGLEEHFREIGLLRGTLIQLARPTVRDFPNASVESQLLRKMGDIMASTTLNEAKARLYHDLLNRTPLNNFPSEQTKAVARLLGAPMISPHEKTVTYHSKHWLRNEPLNSREESQWEAKEMSYNIAPGFSFESVDQLLTQIGSILPQFSPTEDTLTVWVKYASFSAGDGVFKVQLDREDLVNPRSLINKILGRNQTGKSAEEVAKKCGYIDPEAEEMDGRQVLQTILQNVPMVLEVDIKQLPDTKEVLANFNIQAVIGHHMITLIETSLQETGANGNYMGNILPAPPDLAPHVSLAEVQFLLLCQRARNEGYRGYAGGDVIVRQKKNGEHQAMVIDFNPRFNGSTPFNSHIHRLRAETGAEIHGLNTNLILPQMVTTFHEIRDILGNHILWNPKKSEGLIPTAMRGTPELPDKVVKMSVISPTREGVFNLLRRLEARRVQYGSY